MWVNRLQVLIGLLGLLLGTMVYLVDRPPETTYFIYSSTIGLSLYRIFPDFFGLIGHNLPSFFHIFSFILLTAGFFSCRKRGYFIICVSWLFVECAFELGQRYGAFANDFFPEWFEGIPYLENTANYFRYGTFDVFDVIAMLMGTIAAYFILLITTIGGTRNGKTAGN